VNHAEHSRVEEKHEYQGHQETYHNTNDVVDKAQAQLGWISGGEVIKFLPSELYERHEKR